MEIKTLRKIRFVMGILSLTCLSIVIYTAINNMTTTMSTASIITILMCIAGIVVTIIVRWKEIDKGLF